MTWQVPQSVTQIATVANLGTDDDVLVASGVTIASTGQITIVGTGSNHEALIYGTVASTNAGLGTIVLGNGDDSNQTVTIKPGGQVYAFGLDGLAIGFDASSSHVINQGLIAAPDGFGISLGSQSATTTSTVVNGGTIDVATTAIVRGSVSTETIVLQNSGLISGDDAAYAPFAGNPNATDLITNTGQMIGDIELAAGNDVYNGAKGRLTGTVFAGDGNDTIAGGKDNDIFFGDAGNDKLTGGLGRDRSTGGTGRDFFDFNAIAESKKGASRDVITDFNRPADDRIDLATIDAKTGLAGNQAFKFIGTAAFHDVKGELRASGGIVQGDRNGDGTADFEIKVNLATMQAGDFFL